jgi:hypothetical protein
VEWSTVSSERSTVFFKGPAFYRIAPFAAFMLFIAGEEGLAFLHRHEIISLSEAVRLWLYAPRVALVGALLFAFRRHYVEIDSRDLLKLRQVLISVAVGVVIFALWIKMDWTLSSQTTPSGFDPRVLGDGPGRWLMTAVRCAGAVIVVPIMEELFWRSFLLRYLIDNDFMKVAIGRLTWFSLLATTLLFGLEHHYLFAGMMAGALFSLVYYWTRSIVHCILCHAVANLCLAIYVLATAQWQFW